MTDASCSGREGRSRRRVARRDPPDPARVHAVAHLGVELGARRWCALDIEERPAVTLTGGTRHADSAPRCRQDQAHRRCCPRRLAAYPPALLAVRPVSPAYPKVVAGAVVAVGGAPGVGGSRTRKHRH